MAEWYVHVAGQQYGPIDQNTLDVWIRQRRILRDTLVWKQGMPEWAAAGSLSELQPSFEAPPLAVDPAQPALPTPLTPARPGGTRGKTPNADLTTQARDILRGRWGLPIGASFLLGLIMSGPNHIPYIGGLLSLILNGPFQTGGNIFYLNFARTRHRAKLEMIFWGFKRFGKSLGAFLLVTLFSFGWMLLGAVFVGIGFAFAAVTSTPIGGNPGMAVLIGLSFLPMVLLMIWAELRYSQTLYIIADDSKCGPLQAIKRSIKLMDGRKSKLLWLQFRFLGWAILCIFTLFIGFLWLVPYMSVTYARFFDDLHPPHKNGDAPHAMPTTTMAQPGPTIPENPYQM